jgi:hypothetical protein
MKHIGISLIALFLLIGNQPAAAQSFFAPDTAPEPAARLHPRYDPILAQNYSSLPSPDSAASALPIPKYGGWVTVTKWATLATAAGFGVLGFKLHNDADAAFEELQLACQQDPDACENFNPDGSYQDPELEALYQNVVKKDKQARITLIASQVSFGVSVVLFIVDFQRKTDPTDIPYDPDSEKSALRVTVESDEIAVRYYLR